MDLFNGAEVVRRRNLMQAVVPSAVQAATWNTRDMYNYNCRGGKFVIDMTVVPGVQTVTPKVQGYDSASGKYYDILVGPAIVATGTTVLDIYPGLTAAANAAANAIVPFQFRLVFTHSGAGNFTYSAGVNLAV